MQGKIEEIRHEADGKTTVIISTVTGPKKLYGLPNTDVAPGSVVEYETRTSQSGFPYAKFNRYISIVPVFDVQEKEADNDTSSEADEYMTVSELNRMIKTNVQNTPGFQNFWVKGEVTNYSGHTKHYYFCIKDENALISCILWEDMAESALDFTLEKGQQVAIRGSLEYSDKMGKCSVVVSKMINIGEGDAKLKYEQLKEKLQNEGIFDVEHHKEIPRHAQRVGIVTSKDGQAIRDICKVAKERNPFVQLVLFHVNVQGVRAVSTTVEGIKRLDEEGVDVIIVGRGGGSDEELLVYDDETLIRAVYAAKTPIVSAVGHAGHKPLVDYAADEKFATPTDAAQHVISDVMSEIKRVDELLRQMSQKASFSVSQRQMRLAKLKAELEKNSPAARLQEKKNRLDAARQRMRSRMDQIFAEKSRRCEVLIANLNGLSPTAKLVRGFGYISMKDKPLTSIAEVSEGDELSIRIHDGEISTRVVSVEKKEIK